MLCGDVEFAGIGAGLAPGHHPFAVDREFVDAGVAVAVGDVEVFAVRRHRGVGAAMERLAAHIGRRFAGNADRQQDFAVERALADRVVGVVSQPDRVVRRHEHAVRPRKDPLAPGAQQIALAVKDAHRVLAAVEGIDIVVFIDPDRRDIGVELHAGRQFGPAVIDLVTVAVRPQYDRHVLSPRCFVGAIRSERLRRRRAAGKRDCSASLAWVLARQRAPETGRRPASA